MMAVNEIGLPALHPRQGCVLKTDASCFFSREVEK